MQKSFRNSIFSIPEVDILDLQEFVRVNNKSCIKILRDLAIPQKGGQHLFMSLPNVDIAGWQFNQCGIV